MTNVSPGVLADAHRVRNLLRGSYTSWDKDVARRKVLRSLASVQPSLVLDLWGGGVSADAFVDLGLSVLSVEDGRYPKRLGLSTARTRRALVVCANEGRYDARWGRADNFAQLADAAFLDFVGHWSKDKRAVLMACRHMKAIAVTLMPERAEFGNLTEHDWLIAYRALLEDATGMRVTWTHPYKRESGLPAIVFFLRPMTRDGSLRECEDCGQPRPAMAKKFCRDCAARRRSLRPPGPRTYNAERQREYNRRRRTVDPERVRADKRASYQRHKDTARAYYDAHADEIKARNRARQRSIRQMAAVSGTTAEAISSEEAA